jgi:hypothetical protein
MPEGRPLPSLRPRSTRPGDRTFRLRSAFAVLVGFAVLLLAEKETAALLVAGDGTGNTTAPSPDPGFGRVGSVNGLTGVYVRNGWVLTASHVGEGAIMLGGASYAPIAGSTVHFRNADSTYADLIAFKLATRPPLPDIAIADSPTTIDSLIMVIGNGRDRGVATSWMGLNGWTWASTRSLRWGTNRISGVDLFALTTHAFRIDFDNPSGSSSSLNEADVVTGDSGGGAFTGSGASGRLIGILFAHASFVGQPANTSVFGNAGLIVDLYAYRDQILAITDRPDCGDGLDNDGDGLADYLMDPGCVSAADTSERSSSYTCDNGIDDDSDGLVDFPADPGCVYPTDVSERGAIYQCDNGIDDDGDLAIDFPNDTGCLHPTNPIEAPEPDLDIPLATGLLGLMTFKRIRRSRVTQTSSTRSTR